MSDQIQVEVQAIFGSDRDVAESAWTSSLTKIGKERRSDEDVKNVCKRIVSEGHGTPVESIIFRIWIRMPISSDRQHMTHRIASHNGMSGRYRTMPSDFLEMPDDVADIISAVNCGFSYEHACQEANRQYTDLISELKEAEKEHTITNAELKRAREFVRGLLPQNNLTERTTIMNLRSLGNYFIHRLSGHAQPEIRDVAFKIYRGIYKHPDFHKIRHTWLAAEQRNFIFQPDPDEMLIDLMVEEREDWESAIRQPAVNQRT